MAFFSFQPRIAPFASTIHLNSPSLGSDLFAELDVGARAGEVACLLGGRGDLLLGRVRAGDQRLRRFLGFGPRHLRQDERDGDESDEGQVRR